MVGGRSFGKSQFNRTTQARRQPASAFKPFVYLRAIESGLKPDTIIRDEPPLTLETAFAVSDNDATVRLAQRLGLMLGSDVPTADVEIRTDDVVRAFGLSETNQAIRDGLSD
jgi:membrane carboxypeptidase/penicillin-binding protein